MRITRRQGVKVERTNKWSPPPIVFLIYGNSMVDGQCSHGSLFTDDAGIMRRVGIEEECKVLQKDLDRFCKCSQM